MSGGGGRGRGEGEGGEGLRPQISINPHPARDSIRLKFTSIASHPIEEGRGACKSLF